MPPEDEKPKIEEPPVDPESDTQRLKVLRRDAVAEEPEQDNPPATILQGLSANKPDLPPPHEAVQDTNRVRLVPRMPEPLPWRLIMQTVGPKTATIGLDVRQTLVIGRADSTTEEQPDLDLSPHDAYRHGISRQHAVLIPTTEALFLVDLDSTNGTWVNGGYLEPGHRHTLTPGDRVEFGLLKLRVKTILAVNRNAG